MSDWKYLAADIRTGEIIDELPLSGVSFTRTLSGVGDFSGTVNLRGLLDEDGTPNWPKRDAVLDGTQPAKRCIYVARGDRLFWGGVIWPRPWAMNDPMTISAAAWGSYFQRRLLTSDLSYSASTDDQFAIVRGLITWAQTQTGGNARVRVEDHNSGRKRDRNYKAGDLDVIHELIDNLANVIDGFDYLWEAEYDPNGRPRGVLRLGYPRLGALDPVITVETGPSDAVNLGLDENGAEFTVRSWAVGKPATEGATVPVASSTDVTLFDQGYLLLDKVRNYGSVSVLTTLQEHADADQRANGGVLVSIPATVTLDRVLAADVNPGDPAEVIIEPNERFRYGYRDVMRITAMTYRPEENRCDLTLSPRVLLGGRIPVTETEQRRVARLAREVRHLHVSR